MTKNKSKLGIWIGLGLIVAVIAGGLWFLTSPVGYMSIDVNPSLEMTYNRMNKVVELKGNNSDGVALLKSEKFSGLDVDDAVRKVVELLLEEGYLVDPESKMLLSADGSEDSRELLTRINYQITYWLKEYYENTDVFSQVLDLDKEDMKKAEKLGISYGKYALLKSLFDDMDDVDDDRFDDMTIGEIIAFAKANDIPLNNLILNWDDDWDDMDDDDDDDMDDDDDDDMDDDDDDDMDDDDDDDMDDDDDDDMDDDDDDDMDDDDDDDLEDDDDDDLNDDDDDDDLNDDIDDDYDDIDDDDDDDDYDDVYDNDDDDYDDDDDDDWDDDYDDDDDDDDDGDDD